MRYYFWRYSVVACLKFSLFNSWLFTLDFTWNCCRLQEAKKLSRNPGKFKCVTRETRYHVSITELWIRNLQSQVADLVWRPKLKILYFNGGHLFMTGVENLFLYWAGRHGDWRDNSANLLSFPFFLLFFFYTFLFFIFSGIKIVKNKSCPKKNSFTFPLFFPNSFPKACMVQLPTYSIMEIC